jgi:hypothetical protein
MKAVIINGFHKGHVVEIKPSQTIKLLKPRTIEIDCCDSSVVSDSVVNEYIEYKVCLAPIGNSELALFSEKGKPSEFIEEFMKDGSVEATSKPWTRNTVLKFGYHGEEYREDYCTKCGGKN